MKQTILIVCCGWQPFGQQMTQKAAETSTSKVLATDETDLERRNGTDTATAKSSWNYYSKKTEERPGRPATATFTPKFSQKLWQLRFIRAVSPFKIRVIRDELLTLLLTFPRPSAAICGFPRPGTPAERGRFRS